MELKAPQDQTIQNETAQNDLDKKTKRRFRLLKQIPTYDIKYEEDKDTAWRRLELLKKNLNSFREAEKFKKVRPSEENEGKLEIDLDNDAQYREELEELEKDVKGLVEEEKKEEYEQKVNKLNLKIEQICKRYLKKKSMSLGKLKVAVEVKDPEGDLDPALASLKQRNTVYIRPKEVNNHTLTEPKKLNPKKKARLYPSDPLFRGTLDDKPTDTVFIKGNNKEGNTHFIAFCNRLYKKKGSEDPELFLDVDCGYREGACLRYSEIHKKLIVCKNKTTIAVINPERKKDVGILLNKKEIGNTDLDAIKEEEEDQQGQQQNANNNQNSEAVGKSNDSKKKRRN